MTRREELRKIGIDDELIDMWLYDAYEEQKRKLEQAKKRKLEMLSKMSLIDRFIDRLIYETVRKMKVKNGNSRDTIPEFTGDKNNPIEVYQYNSRYGIMPTKTIDNPDGTFTHIYKQNDRVIKVNVKVNLSGIPMPSKEEMEKFEIDQKRLLAELLPVSEEEIIDMSDEQVLKLIKDNEQNIKIIYN